MRYLFIGDYDKFNDLVASKKYEDTELFYTTEKEVPHLVDKYIKENIDYKIIK